MTTQATTNKTVASGATAEHFEAIHCLAIAGITWATLWAWAVQYGWPILLQVLAIVLPFLKGGNLPALGSIVTWFEAALTALAAGQPVPPFPTV